MSRASLHCYISGKVQGVWFRASTKEKAQALNVTGLVRNLADGRVEVLAFGEAQQIAALKIWLQQGPRLAEVKEVMEEEVAWQDHDDFRVL